MPLMVEQRGAIGILTLSNPGKRNAWESDYGARLREELARFEEDPAIRCVILTGDEAGNAFSAGADVKDGQVHSQESMGAFLGALKSARSGSTFATLTNFAKPLIGVVNGYAIGVGALASFCCDLIIASDKAEWRLPQAAMGIIPAEAGITRAAQFIGKGHAMRLALGFALKAQEAHALGLAQWLVPHEEIALRSMEIAERVAALAPLSVLMMKESFSSGTQMPIAQASLLDRYRFAALCMTDDKQEGHRVARTKGKPEFKGR